MTTRYQISVRTFPVGSGGRNPTVREAVALRMNRVWRHIDGPDTTTDFYGVGRMPVLFVPVRKTQRNRIPTSRP